MTATTDPLSVIVDTARGAKHLASLTFPFDPVPASRPKVSRWGVYYGKTYKTWKESAEKHLPAGDLDLSPTDPVLVVIIAVCKRAKTSKAAFPKGDVDNLAKGPMDVVTKATGYWADDKQVMWLLSGKRWAQPDEEPRTEVHLYKL
ncbi:RusA family crossover junction endodeoxyribonuclease [Stenotrophomonas maltophilia]|uniref:RusA family crossover junction endodeoxyribonuclease n=1 Tax=Stenotrophomonas maltophilia TaxID=40324 RepID=UPI0013DD01A1|nr:RusA family crossover junction endodeoxyribonuclease [Stenotrophomonas maltophilia]